MNTKSPGKLHTEYHNCCVNSQKIHILHNKSQELCNESSFLQELDRMNAILNAKYDFNNRDDVVFYISSDDLLKIQCSKSPVFIRLRPDQPSSKITLPYIESVSKLKSSHGPDSPKSDSPKSRNCLSEKSRSSSSSIKRLSFEYKKISLEGNQTPINICYKPSDTQYSIFFIEQKGSDVICKGLKDSEVDNLEVKNLRGIHVKYIEKSLDAYVYVSDVTNIRLPLYFLFTTLDYTCKVQNFVDMIEPLISLVKNKSLENQ